MCYSFGMKSNTIMCSESAGGLDFTMNKFVVTPKEDKTVTMTIRIDRTLQEEYNKLSAKTNRSRNELITMALQYALENMELKNTE